MFVMTTSGLPYVNVIAQHSEVTGSSFLLYIRLSDGEIVQGMLDCGIFQEPNYDEENEKLLLDDPKQLDFVLVTHTHVDHCGRIPLLYRRGYEGSVHCTYNTAMLMPHALHDTAKILKERAKKLKHKVLFGDGDVVDTMKGLIPHNYLKPFYLGSQRSIKITFLPNGHLLGAAMILMEVEGKTNLLFTGDYHDHNVFFEVEDIPEKIKQLPVTIICESTYGDTSGQELEHEVNFESNVEEALKKQKSVLLPAFSLGRTQEILYRIRKLQEVSEVLYDTPIYLDGNLGITYTDIYHSGALQGLKSDMQDFLPHNFFIVKDNDMRMELVSNTKPKIIVTSSGMGKYGPAQFYIPEFLKRKEMSLIQFSGYCAEGTYGRELKEDEQYQDIVKSSSEFSAHGRKEVLLGLIQQFQNVRSVIINHGNTETKEHFKEYVAENTGIKKIEIASQQDAYRVGQYGIMKHLTMIKNT